jgi:hypothetical protein
MLGILVTKGLSPIEINKHTKYIVFMEKSWKVSVLPETEVLELVFEDIQSDLATQFKKRRKIVRAKLDLLREDLAVHNRDISRCNLEVRPGERERERDQERERERETRRENSKLLFGRVPPKKNT